MCLIVFAQREHPRYPIILAANRDEYYDRPTAPAAFWPDCPQILGGRDLKAGGTWMGITRAGRFAALTNYREPTAPAKAYSRGDLVSGFLTGLKEPENYLRRISRRGDRYNGFNLLVGDQEGVWYYSNRADRVTRAEPGIHGLSNHLLDTPWPKVTKAKAKIAVYLAVVREVEPEPLLTILADSDPPPDDELPDTGVGLARERMLGTIFIASPGYGTRCSTVLTIDYAGNVCFVERTAGHDAVYAYKLTAR